MGILFDIVRMRWVVGEVLYINLKSVEGYVFGEYGEL